MVTILIVLVTALVFEAVGVVFLSKGLKELPALTEVTIPNLWDIFLKGITNGHIILGVALEAVFFAGLLYLLSKKDVSVVWPLTSLGFVVTTLAAKIFLHENVSPVRWLGVSLIVAGAGFISWSERNKPPGTTVQEVEQAINKVSPG